MPISNSILKPSSGDFIKCFFWSLRENMNIYLNSLSSCVYGKWMLLGIPWLKINKQIKQFSSLSPILFFVIPIPETSRVNSKLLSPLYEQWRMWLPASLDAFMTESIMCLLSISYALLLALRTVGTCGRWKQNPNYFPFWNFSSNPNGVHAHFCLVTHCVQKDTSCFLLLNVSYIASVFLAFCRVHFVSNGCIVP